MANQTRGLGTPLYEAPELVLSHDECYVGYGLGADIWAFGCVVFEMVAGQPFVFASPQDRISAMVARLGNPPTLAGVASMQGVSSLACALRGGHPFLLFSKENDAKQVS